MSLVSWDLVLLAVAEFFAPVLDDVDGWLRRSIFHVINDHEAFSIRGGYRLSGTNLS